MPRKITDSNRPPCPFCGWKLRIFKKDKMKDGRQRWQCGNCKRTYVPGGGRPRKPRAKNTGNPCQRCGSLNNYVKGTVNGVDRVYCRDCGRYSQKEYSRGIRDPSPRTRKPTHINPNGRFCQKEKIHSRILKNQYALKVDSIYNIPCFGCKANCLIGFCNPERCPRLDRWLLAVTISPAERAIRLIASQ